MLHKVLIFLVWPMRTGTISSSMWHEALFPSLASGSFPHMYTLINNLLDTPGKSSADLRDSLHAALFILIFCLRILTILVSLYYPLFHHLNSKSLLASTMLQMEILPRKLEQSQGLPHLFLLSQRSLPFISW